MAQVPVYRKDTGERVYVPEHWLDNKILSQPFRKTPPAPRSTAAGDNTKKES